MDEQIFDAAVAVGDNCHMPKKRLSFRDVLEGVTQHMPSLRTAEGRLVATRVAEYCAKQGYPVSQPTLSRHLRAGGPEGHKPDPETIAALIAAFRIPRELLEGEHMSAELDTALTRSPLEDLFLAERISRLKPGARRALLIQLEEIEKREAELQRALQGTNVTSLDRKRT